jgi:5-formyltetrahydrofolate cyclo-ligase
MRSMLDASGFDVLLPRVAGDRLEWVLDEGATTMSSMGIEEPAGPAVSLLPARALLIPALAVTALGDRLGKGGGFYDRVLAELGDDRPEVIAVVGDADVVEHVPSQEHDQRVDWIVTPTRVIECRGTHG